MLSYSPQVMTDAATKYLYAAGAYALMNAALFTFAPQVPAADSFGKEEAEKNKPLLTMTEVCGTMFGVLGVTSLVAARGHDAATAVHCGMSLLPLRMVYDFMQGTTPPPPAMAMTGALVAAGMYTTMQKGEK